MPGDTVYWMVEYHMGSKPAHHPRSPKNVLITGPPGVGKTTVIMTLVHHLQPYHPTGFYTREIREDGVRQGFELVSLDGSKGVLAHVDIESSHRIGKYRVDVSAFERFLLKIPLLEPDSKVIVIDEIGKMECCSKTFMDSLAEWLDGNRPVVATIALKGGGTIETVKRRSDVVLFKMNRSNRDLIITQVLNALMSVLPPILP